MLSSEPNLILVKRILSVDVSRPICGIENLSSPQNIHRISRRADERVASASPKKVPVPPLSSSTLDRPFSGRSLSGSMSSSSRISVSPPTQPSNRKRPSISIAVALDEPTEACSDDVCDGSMLSLQTPAAPVPNITSTLDVCSSLFLVERQAQSRAPVPTAPEIKSKEDKKELQLKASLFLSKIPFSVLLGFRRMLRRIRESKLFSLRLKRPTIEILRRDAFLDTYSSKTLLKFVEALQIRYFFPGELVISRGLIERECYVVCSGSLRVFMKAGDPPVAVLGVGSVVGSFGFTLEEPRSATVIASPEAPCLLWCITRTAFEWMDNKEAEWRRLFALFHQDMLQSQQLTKFPCFSGVSDRSLEILLKSGVPMSVNKGEPISLKRNNPIYVLDGSVRVTMGFLSHNSSQQSSTTFGTQSRRETSNHEALLLESLGRIVDISSGLKGDGVHMEPLAPPSDAGSPLTPFLTYRKATISAPCVIGAFSAVFPYEALSNVRIDAASSAEVLVMQWSVLDELAKLQIAQNCSSRRQRRAQRLDENDVREVLFGDLPNFLRVKNNDHVLVQKLVTFNPGDVINFDYASGMNALIVQRGELDDPFNVVGEEATQQEKPFRLWPDIALIYYGAKQRITARSTVTGCLVSRRQVVAHLALNSTEAELGLLVRHFNERYASLHSSGERPIFASMPPPQAGEPSYGGGLDHVIASLRGLHQDPQPVRVVDSLRKMRRASNSSRSEPIYQHRRQSGGASSPIQPSTPRNRDSSPPAASACAFRRDSKGMPPH